MKIITDYTIYCTEEQTKRALELGAPLEPGTTSRIPHIQTEDLNDAYNCPTAEQMIGFILDSGRGYAIDLAELIKESGYKQGCLTFINQSLL